jgi:ABC-type branched-subunit amino acid transport system substrate-binding protein
VVAGCTTTTPAPTVSGKTLTLYLSAPASVSEGCPSACKHPEAQDVLDAEQLAFNQLKGQVRGNLRVLRANKISDNARKAIEDTTSAVAYVGEIEPGTSTDSLGITNAEDLLQVSPAESAPVPTKDFQSYSTYGRTFASMAPGSNQEAQTLVGGSAGRAFVRDFASSYGHAPSTQAIFGYVATAAVLKALQNAGSDANNRGTIRNDFFELKDVQLPVGPGGPVLGTYTVNKNGTVTITPASGSTAP